jgi:hypothetical protein
MTYQELVFDGLDEFEVMSVDKQDGKVILSVESKHPTKYI